jgi:hypothetical protein
MTHKKNKIKIPPAQQGQQENPKCPEKERRRKKAKQRSETNKKKKKLNSIDSMPNKKKEITNKSKRKKHLTNRKHQLKKDIIQNQREGWYIPFINIYLVHPPRKDIIESKMAAPTTRVENMYKRNYASAGYVMQGYYAEKQKNAGPKKAQRKLGTIRNVVKKHCPPPVITNHAAARLKERGINTLPVPVWKKDQTGKEREVIVTFLPVNRPPHQKNKKKVVQRKRIEDAEEVIKKRSEAARRLCIPREAITTSFTHEQLCLIKADTIYYRKKQHTWQIKRREKAYARAGCNPSDLSFFIQPGRPPINYSTIKKVKKRRKSKKSNREEDKDKR